MEAIIKVHPQAIKWYVERSWNVSYQSILYKCLLNDMEIYEIKSQLQELYYSIPADNFVEEAESYLQRFNEQIECLRNRNGLSRKSVFDFFTTLVKEKIKVKLME